MSYRRVSADFEDTKSESTVSFHTIIFGEKMKLKLERNMNMCNLATSYAVLPDGDAQPHTAHVNKPITFEKWPSIKGLEGGKPKNPRDPTWIY